MPNTFAPFADSPTSPAQLAYAVTPHDTQELPTVTKAIYVGTTGNVMLQAVRSSQDVLLRNVQAGSIIDIQARIIRATGTTASDIVGLA
jgi:hypothetical protein